MDILNTVGIGMPGTTEMLIIFFAIILLFGAKKLPELSRSLGKSLGEFKKGQREGRLPDTKDDETLKKEIIEPEENVKEEPKK